MFLDEINSTIDRHEAMRRKEEAARDRANEEKKLLREMNGKLMSRCIQTAISPVFYAARETIVARGFFCDVHIISKKDYLIQTAMPVAVSIKMSVKPGSEKQPVETSHLTYEGGFENQGVSLKRVIYVKNGGEPHVDSNRFVVTDIDASLVEDEVSDFIKSVFLDEPPR